MTDVIAAKMIIEVDGDDSAPPVVMIHGLGGSSNAFALLMPGLRGFRVIRPDLLGAGRSPTRRGSHRLPELGRQLVLALSLLGVKRAHLVGHSMGTWICQWLAAEHPDLVESMVLFGAITEPAQASRDALRERAAAVRHGGLSQVATQIATHTIAARSLDTQPLIAAYVRESVMRQSAEGYAALCEALAEAVRIDPLRIRCPVTLVTGRDDPVTPPSMAHSLADRLGHARLQLIDNCGHWTPIEAPQVCGEALRHHLIRHARAGA
ncbi:MAG: alpha/beta hydrolase [Burkholderiaceae bacterium]